MLCLLGAPLAWAVGAQAPQGGTAVVVGQVVDARTSQPLARATVQVDGSRLGGVTGDDGRFRITGLPAGAHALTARRLGYSSGKRSVTLAAGQQGSADFALGPAATALDEVVITGTAGGAERRTIGNAVSTISAAEAMSRSQAPNISGLLNARAPGVIIAQGSGRLGAGPNIQIRGLSSLSLDNSPLLYVDGVRVNNAVASGPGNSGGFGAQGAQVAGRLNDISPEDIESIEIIKGPAAATIYGTEAANGVIQVITKKGIAGARPQLRLKAQTGAIFFRDAANRLPTNYVKDSTGTVVAWNGVTSEQDRGTPIFRTGQSRLYNMDLSGGRDQVRYFVSSSYQNDIGIEPNNSARQFNAHANLNVSPSDKIEFGTSLNFVQANNHLGADVGLSPILGAEVGHILLFKAARGFFPNVPPEVPQQLYDNSDGLNRFTGSGTVSHRPTSWFTQRVVFGLDYTGSDSRALERFAPVELVPIIGATAAAGRIAQTLRSNTVATADYSGTAKFDLGPAFSSSSSVGGQFYRTELNSSFLGGQGFPASGVETVSATAKPFQSTQTQILNTTIGGYAQEQVGWRDRLFVTAALRVDNNSAFGSNFKLVAYPKVSASWVVNEEPFWNVGFINTLKLRAAYGESGRAPATFSALRSFLPVQGPGGTSAVTPGAFGNPDLKPERGKEFEGGFEAMLFNRLSLDLTAYRKRTVDGIINQPVAPSSGFSGNQVRNIGEVKNSGLELQASLQAISRSNFSWEITGNVATAHNEIVDLGGLPAGTSPGQANVVGYPIGAYFGRRVISADRDPSTQFATNIKCAAADGSPVACSAAPLTFLGNPTPTASGSVGNTFEIGKRLRLYGLVDFKRGNRLYNAIEGLRCSGALGIGMCDANYNPQNYSPLYLAELSANGINQGIYDQFIQDASFAKLRELSATITLPPNFVPRTGGATVTFSARELHTWTKYRGPDPEINAAPSTNVANGTTPAGFAFDQGVTPPLTRFTVSLNLTF
jgi:TonB-linked SusC/RagA family outer membrane protein